MTLFPAICIFSVYLLSCNTSDNKSLLSVATLTQKDSCDNPDGDINCNFLGAPSLLTNTMPIAAADEPGMRLHISGTCYKADGKTPYPGLIIYAYHTNAKGLYEKKGNEKGIQKWHGYLHGWCLTDDDGKYVIETIRPAPYPGNTIPAHIHSAIKTPGGNAFYISDFVFKDDALVDDKYLNNLPPQGGTGIVTVQQDGNGKWFGERDIIIKN